jgi:hypothetical protein
LQPRQCGAEPSIAGDELRLDRCLGESRSVEFEALREELDARLEVSWRSAESSEELQLTTVHVGALVAEPVAGQHGVPESFANRYRTTRRIRVPDPTTHDNR